MVIKYLQHPEEKFLSYAPVETPVKRNFVTLLMMGTKFYGVMEC